MLKDTLRVRPRSHTQTDLRPHSSPTSVRTKKNGHEVDVGEGFRRLPQPRHYARSTRPTRPESVLASRRWLVAGMDLPPSILND